MISKNNVKSVQCDSIFDIIYLKIMYNKKVIRFGFCNIRNNQGLCKFHQPRPSARLITLTSTLIIVDIAKTSCSSCLVFVYLQVHGLITRREELISGRLW